MLQPSDYLKIGKRGEACAACGKSLLEEPRLASVLIEDEEEQEAPQEAAPEEVEQTEEAPAEAETEAQAEADDDTPPEQPRKKADEEEEEPYRRIDYCPECWAEIKDRAYFSFWLGKPRDDDAPKRRLNKAERNLALAALFDSLVERQDEAEEDFTPHLFFLAHLLMKFKIFKWKPGTTDPDSGARMLLFDRTDCDEEVTIPDILMPPEMVVKVKEEVEAYLKESTGQAVAL